MNSAKAVERARRREQSRYLPEPVVVSRNTPVSDGSGGTTDSWGDVTQPAEALDSSGVLRGRVDPAGAGATLEEQVIADKITAQQPYIITVAHGADVTAADRLVVDGVTYEAVGVVAGSWTPNPKVACTRQE